MIILPSPTPIHLRLPISLHRRGRRSRHRRPSLRFPPSRLSRRFSLSLSLRPSSAGRAIKVAFPLPIDIDRSLARGVNAAPYSGCSVVLELERRLQSRERREGRKLPRRRCGSRDRSRPSPPFARSHACHRFLQSHTSAVRVVATRWWRCIGVEWWMDDPGGGRGAGKGGERRKVHVGRVVEEVVLLRWSRVGARGRARLEGRESSGGAGGERRWSA